MLHRNINFPKVILTLLGLFLLSLAVMAGRYSYPENYVLDGEILEVKQEMVDGETREEDFLSRHRRYLLYKNSSLFQCTFAYGFPMELMPRRNVIIVLGGQIAYDLPFQLSKLTVQTVARDSPDISQPNVFRAAEAILDQSGIPGRECMLLAICQLAETPLHHDFGILEDLIHLMLTPSAGSHPDDWRSKNEKEEYFTAERIGIEGKDCQISYPKCNVSLLEAFTRIMIS